MRRGVLAWLMVLVVAAPAGAHELRQATFPPPNDLLALGHAGGDRPDPVEIKKPPAPPIEPAARAQCGPGSRPEPSIQGRVPAGSAAEGLWCNVEVISHHGSAGGFKVFDYVDSNGHECAIYDTALVFPLNAFNLDSSSLGVAVLDMADPAKPVQTATLTEPAMLSPHESLALNEKRGLLAAVSGNPSTYPGWVSVYDLSRDCRNPELQFSGPIARLGHESGFSEDGKTFYATGTAYRSITAIDLTDPKNPFVVWQGDSQTHGMTLRPDGNRAYLANPDVRFGDLIILDTSEIQARKENPHAREIARITWDRISIPQNAQWFTVDGKPYVLEYDEYNASTLDPSGDPDQVGAGRIIDISDERNPRIVGHLRLEINEPGPHEEFQNDPGAAGPANGGGQGYAAHYCNIPTHTDPKLVACSFIASGLRLFDISDLSAPKEIAYYVAPATAKPENQGQASNYAMSQPAFVPERREIWFSDAVSGFYALRVSESVWPRDAAGPARRSARRRCSSARRFDAHVRVPRGARIAAASAKLRGKRVKVRRRGRVVTVPVNLRGMRRVTARLVIRVKLRSGRTIVSRRTYHPCRPGSRSRD
jgi:hypothetical protein